MLGEAFEKKPFNLSTFSVSQKSQNYKNAVDKRTKNMKVYMKFHKNIVSYPDIFGRASMLILSPPPSGLPI